MKNIFIRLETAVAIQLFVPRFHVDECLEQIRECLEKGWTGMGFKTLEMEKAWKDYTNLPNAHFLSSNTAGLHLALEVFRTRYNWQEADEIITTPLTFVSSNHAILYAGLTPVFADVDEYLCLDPNDIEKRITSRTRAVMFVGLGGNAGRYELVRELCLKHGLKLILDAAHMSGTRVEGRHAGHGADVSVFSYQAVKNLPTADAGMICFTEEENDALARKMSWLGINKDTFARTAAQGNYKWMYEVENLGYKYHGNSIMAAIALVQLKYLDKENHYRRQLASWYEDALSDCAARIVPTSPDCVSSRHLIQVLVENRDDVLSRLNERDIFPGVHYRDNTEYSLYTHGAGTCPNAATASKSLISLPLHLSMTKDDVEIVSHHLRDIIS